MRKGRMTSRSDQRRAWTQFVEQRKREQQAKRRKKVREPDPIRQAELEAVLDDLVAAAQSKTNA
jgi:hypothetical protein